MPISKAGKNFCGIDTTKVFFISVARLFRDDLLPSKKQDSAAQQQLDQRKVELDAREEALDERKSALDDRERESALDDRQKALDEREKASAQKEKAAMNARTNPTDTQGQIPNPAQVQAERDSIVHQFSNSVPKRSQLKAEKAERTRLRQEQLDQSQSGQEEKLRAIESKWQAAGTSGGTRISCGVGYCANYPSCRRGYFAESTADAGVRPSHFAGPSGSRIANARFVCACAGIVPWG